LRVFDVDDTPFFFGREALVQWLLNEVRPATEDQPVIVFWPSSALGQRQVLGDSGGLGRSP
jgi:hypothetical protein